MTRKKDGIGTIAEKVVGYNVISVFANAASGLSFGHIFQEDAVRAHSELCKMFGKALSVGKKRFVKK